MASPELCPGDGSPRMESEGEPLKRSSFGEPIFQEALEKAEKLLQDHPEELSVLQTVANVYEQCERSACNYVICAKCVSSHGPPNNCLVMGAPPRFVRCMCVCVLTTKVVARQGDVARGSDVLVRDAR